jgi:gliding-associated putative ABC transporter substrate-binding component GldG
VGIKLFGRLDMTDDGVYSLSPASKKLGDRLEDPLTVTAYFTKNLPAPYSDNRRFLQDKLDDYRSYAGAKFHYKFVDPADDEELKRAAQMAGVQPVQIQVIEQDNVQLKNAFMGLQLEYEGESEVIPVVQDMSSLEYDITTAVRRLTTEVLPTVGFLSGHGETDFNADMQMLSRELRRNYALENVTNENGVLSSSPAALLVVAPTDTIPDADLRAIDEYVMGGGRLGLLLNTVQANLQFGQTSPLFTGIEALTAPYGVSVETNLVTDEESSVVTMQRRQGFFNVQQQIPYPFLPVVSRFDDDHPMVNRMRDLVLYFASTIDTSAALPEGVAMTPLMTSSPNSDTQQGFFQIQPQLEGRLSYSGGPFVLAAAFTGTFPSAFTPTKTSIPTRLVVVGDGDILNETTLGAIPGNVSFGLNLVDWLVQDEDLLSIRTKTVAARPLDDVPDGLRNMLKYLAWLGPVILIVGYGLLRWRRREARQIILAG